MAMFRLLSTKELVRGDPFADEVYLGIPKSNIQHWDRNSNFHFKPSKRCTQRSYREIGPGAGILTTRRIFLARF